MAATDTPPVGRKADKKIRDALLAALRDEPNRLKKAAEKAWDMAGEGDMTAFKEIADRIDGKCAQPVSGDDENPLNVIHRIERSIVDPKNSDS